MPPIIHMVSIFFMAGFKFMVAVMMSYGFDLSFLYSVIVCTTGGIAGVFIYIFFGELILTGWKWFFRKNETDKIPINKRTRLIVRIKHMHGLLGIAILTPVFLSVPVGTIAAIAMGYSWKRVAVYMLISLFGWSLFFFGLYEISGIQVNEWLERVI